MGGSHRLPEAQCRAAAPVTSQPADPKTRAPRSAAPSTTHTGLGWQWFQPSDLPAYFDFIVLVQQDVEDRLLQRLDQEPTEGNAWWSKRQAVAGEVDLAAREGAARSASRSPASMASNGSTARRLSPGCRAERP